MTDQNDTAPAVWDPTARGGAGGWVRGPRQPGPESGPQQPDPRQPARPQQPADAAPPAPQAPPARPVAPPPGPGGVGDQGPPLGARPYLATAPGYDAPSAPAFPSAAPPPPPVPPASPFPAHAGTQAAPRAPGPYPGPGYQYPPRPGHPAQPDHPGGYEDLDDDEDRPTNRKAPLLIGFALLLVLAVGGGLLMTAKDDGTKDQAAPTATASGPAPSGNPQPAPAPSGSPGDPSTTPTDPAPTAETPSPTATTAGPNAKAQAGALDDLLTQGESAKAPIGSAVAKVSSCPAKADIADAAQVFDNGARQRDELLRKLGALSASDVPGGADAVQSLKSAWPLSADIDRAYAAWARSVANQGCSGTAPTTADKKHADELNPQATQAKKDFVGKWKPIADAFGLTARTQDRI